MEGLSVFGIVVAVIAIIVLANSFISVDKGPLQS